MCGRLNITDDPISQFLSEVFGLDIKVHDQPDVRPSQSLVTLASSEEQVYAEHARWGIKPQWAKKLIINAQAETVAVKPTFRSAFESRRCLVPCTGWYEWRSSKKYVFLGADDRPFLMAGLLYDDEITQCVTLTTQPAGVAAEIHSRMPQLIRLQDAEMWLQADPKDAQSLLQPTEFSRITVLEQAK